MGKRKRDHIERTLAVNQAQKKVFKIVGQDTQTLAGKTAPRKADSTDSSTRETSTTLQVITGSYERVLHGFQGTVTKASAESDAFSIQFVDTFLFNAHSSAIRCLALSPLPSDNTLSENARVILASGGTDERINLYSLSVSPLPENDRLPSVPTLAGNKILENPNNRELGSLLQHSSSITSLYFPTRSKLLAAAEDNTISVSRTKDFEVVSAIKAPRPKVQGRPSGDTAPPGASPVGVNDFAVHPSMKLMVSVGKGEKCMRLWNLVTGKKAGVLNFTREALESVKDGKYSTGEGRRIEWSPDGEEFAVAFERGIVVYGSGSMPTCKALPHPLTKIHQMRYVNITSKGKPQMLLATSSEDGRVIFFSTTSPNIKLETGGTVPDAVALAELGGKASGVTGRIKDFEIISPPLSERLFIVTAGSDGVVRIWVLEAADISLSSKQGQGKATTTKSIGKIIGTYETGNRITCLKAFLMLPAKNEDGAGEGVTDADMDSEEDEEGGELLSDSDDE